jgi:hypothetical protein
VNHHIKTSRTTRIMLAVAALCITTATAATSIVTVTHASTTPVVAMVLNGQPDPNG